MTMCKHCGVEIRRINYELGPRWMHNPHPGHSRDAYEYCQSTSAEPKEEEPAPPLTRSFRSQ